MEFDGRPIFDRHVEGDIAERVGGDIAIGLFVENDENVNVARPPVGVAADGRAEDV